jgi:hypothetical protein
MGPLVRSGSQGSLVSAHGPLVRAGSTGSLTSMRSDALPKTMPPKYSSISRGSMPPSLTQSRTSSFTRAPDNSPTSLYRPY